MSNQEITWAKELKEPVLNFIKSLNIKKYNYLPAKEGLSEYGEGLVLGFSCFSLKINYILNQTDYLDGAYIEGWKNFINSYQKNEYISLENYFVDPFIDKFYNQKSLENYLKENSKKLLNLIPSYKFELQKN